jgi:hypothetical protein
VMRLVMPAIDNDDFIDTIVQERSGGINAIFFQDIREQWKLRVKCYAVNRGNPESIEPWTVVGPHKSKFQNLYLSPAEDSVQRPILEDLRSRTLQICPACGEDGTPNTLDHYLAKETFPEFSVTPINLFPMCDACQTEKGTKMMSAAHERMFLHPYFDDFVNKQIVHLVIGAPFGAPEHIDLLPDAALSAQEAALVKRHIDELGIKARYHRFFKSEHLRLIRLVKEMRRTGQEVRHTIEIFRMYAAQKSANSWGHVYFTGVLANDQLMSFLETADLPEFI